MDNEFIIIPSTKEKSLAATIAGKLDVPVGDYTLKQVLGSETSITIDSYVNYKKIFLLYNITQPINESIMQILFLCDALRKEGAEKVYLITTYFPYTKMMARNEYNLNLDLFARLLKEVNIDLVYVFGLYNPRIVNYTKIPICNIPLITIFGKTLDDNFTNNKNLLITAIDHAMHEETNEIAKHVSSKTFFPIRKEVNGKVEFEVNYDVSGKDILVIIDTINTAATLIKFANLLTYKGARNISVFSTHGILDKSAIPDIEKSVVKQIFTITHSFSKSEKIRVVSISKIIEEIIKRTIEKKNLKSLLK